MSLASHVSVTDKSQSLPMRNDCHAETLDATQSVQAHCQESDRGMRQQIFETFECTALGQV